MLKHLDSTKYYRIKKWTHQFSRYHFVKKKEQKKIKQIKVRLNNYQIQFNTIHPEQYLKSSEHDYIIQNCTLQI
jgi:hypothetical protein